MPSAGSLTFGIILTKCRNSIIAITTDLFSFHPLNLTAHERVITHHSGVFAMPGFLPYQKIKELIDQKLLNISDFEPSNLEACSYDLRIGTIFQHGQIINKAHDKHSEQFVIKPGEVIYLLTWEEIKLPENICATVFPRNFDSSEGLLVLNPGHIDAGYEGAITVTAINLRKTPLAIQRGRKILTIVFEEMLCNTSNPYKRNISRQEREDQFNAALVAQDTHNLSEIIAQGSDSPYPTKKEVELMIVKHWITVLTLILTAVAALTGIIAVWISMQPKSENNNQNPIPLESPSPTPSPKGTQG